MGFELTEVWEISSNTLIYILHAFYVKETEESASETAEVEARSLGPVTVAGREQQSRVECACAGSEMGVAQEAHVAER